MLVCSFTTQGTVYPVHTSGSTCLHWNLLKLIEIYWNEINKQKSCDRNANRPHEAEQSNKSFRERVP